MTTMKKVKIVVAIVAIVLFAVFCAYMEMLRTNNKILKSNCESLRAGMQQYIVNDSLSAASVMRLQVTKAELEEYNAQLAATCEDLRIKLKRVQTAAQTGTTTTVYVTVPMHDTVIMQDTLKSFTWRDNWTTVEGCIGHDSVACFVENVDTLTQIVHRVPRKFLFFTFGTKAVRQEILSNNPHTKIVFSEYLELR